MKCSKGNRHSSKRLMAIYFTSMCLLSPSLFAQAVSPAGGETESFPWLIVPLLLVILAAIFFWFGRWIYGRKGCEVGAIRSRTFVGVVFPPTQKNPAGDHSAGETLKALRAFSWITFDVPVPVLGPGIGEVAEKKVRMNRVRGQIKAATEAIGKYEPSDSGVDIVVKLTYEKGTPSLISGNYWKNQIQLIRLLPADENETATGESGSGAWNPELVRDPSWLSKKLPSIVEKTLELSGQEVSEARV